MRAAVRAARRATPATARARRWRPPGGVDLDDVRAIAETGVDFISIGALTHSAPSLDFSLLLEPA